jgi:uncharacterized protein (TIGR03437 family)
MVQLLCASTILAQTLTITTTPDDLPTGLVGQPYPATALTASGGLGDYQWSIPGGGLPPGIELSSTGNLSGTPTECGLFQFSPQVQVASTPANTKAWWRLDSDFTDAAGSADGVPSGAVAGQAGKIGGAAVFDGVDDFVNAGTAPAVSGSGGFTIDAWIKTTDQHGVIIQQRDLSGINGEYILSVGAQIPGFDNDNIPGAICWRIFQGTAQGFSFCGGSVADGAWHHIAAIRHPDGTGEIFVDGTSQGTEKRTAAQPMDASLTVFLGADKRDNTFFLNGLLDEVRVTDRALSQAEIVALKDEATGQSTSKSLSLTVDVPGTDYCAALLEQAISPTTLQIPNIDVGQSFSHTFSLDGYSGPVFWYATGLPTGLTLNPTTGVLSGIATQVGSYAVTILAYSAPLQQIASTAPRRLRITDPGLLAASEVTLEVEVELQITNPCSSSPAPGATVGVPYSHQFNSTGGVPPTYWYVDDEGGQAAPGIFLNSSGQISGTPTTEGEYEFTIGIWDSNENDDSSSCTLSVSSPPEITTTSIPAGFAGDTGYSTSLNASGGTPPYTWTSSDLPAGLSLDSTSGVLSGTVPASTQSFTVEIDDDNTVSDTQLLTLTVFDLLQITTSSLPTVAPGEPIDVDMAATGGRSAFYYWTPVEGLPAGFNLTTAGNLTGSTETPGQYTFNINVTDDPDNFASSTLKRRRADAATQQDQVSLTLTVDEPLSITTSSPLPNGQEEAAYGGVTFAASGAEETLIWSHTGNLPTGLTLSSAGVLSGTPAAGTQNEYTIDVTATEDTEGGETDSKQFSLTIDPAPLAITTTSIPAGVAGATGYSTTLQASGGTPSFTWSSADLPSGLSLDSTSGVLSGTVPATTQSFTVSVGDAGSQSDGQLLQLTVFGVLQITTGSLPSIKPDDPVDVDLAGSGGRPQFYFWSQGANWPSGFTLTSAGNLSGTTSTPGNLTFNINLTDDPDNVESGALRKNRADAQTQSTSTSLTLTVDELLSITTASPLPDGQEEAIYGGVNFSTSGADFPVLFDALTSADGLPEGMSLSTAGALSGTPATGSQGPYSFTVTAREDTEGGDVATKSFNLTIDAAPLVITSTDAGSGIEGAAYTQPLTATGGTPPYSWSVVGAMPPGLSQTGPSELGGTLVAGTHPFTIQVEDNAERTKTADLTLVVYETLQVTTASVGSVVAGTAIDEQLSATGGFGPPFTWSQGANWPAGFSLSGDGRLTGSTTTVGTTSFNVQVTDQPLEQTGGIGRRLSASAEPQTVSGTVTIEVVPTLGIDTASVDPGVVNQVYPGAQFAASGGQDGHVWSTNPADLPDGITLSEDGALAGTPLESGSFPFTVSVSDSTTESESSGLRQLSADAAVQTDNRQVTLVIYDTLAVSEPASLVDGVKSQEYAAVQFVATGGQESRSWSTNPEALPNGVSLTEAGLLSGTPTESGSFTFIVEVTDDVSGGEESSSGLRRLAAVVATQSATQEYTLTIFDPLEVSAPESLGAGVKNQEYAAVQFTATGGQTGRSWSVNAADLPAGMSLSPDGALSGTPTEAGDFVFSVEVTDSLGGGGETSSGLRQLAAGEADQVASREYSLTIYDTLEISAPESVGPGVKAAAYTPVQFTATGGQEGRRWSTNADALPDGISLSENGALSGTPTEHGTFPFTAEVTDDLSGGDETGLRQLGAAEATQVASLEYSLVIYDTLTVSTQSVDAGVVNVQYPAFQLAAAGGQEGRIWSTNPDALPNGMTLSEDGLLAGIPTEVGSFPFTAEVTDDLGGGEEATQIATRELTVITYDTISLTTPPVLDPAVIDQPYAAQLQASGGQGSFSFSLGGGTLPPGIEVLADGRIAGTPTTTGSFAFSVEVTDDAGAGELGGLPVRRAAAGTQVVSFNVNLAVNEVLTITTAALENATISAPYSVILNATGGGNDKTWFTAPGDLPAGMSLSEGGVLNGAPDDSGLFDISFGVTDGFQTDTKNLTLEVISALTITTASLPTAKIGAPYSTTVSVAGGVPPYTWTQPSGSLPPGISRADGEFSGTPTEAGTFSFTIKASDGSQSYTRALSIEVLPGDLEILTTVLPVGETGVLYNESIQASGGSPPYSFSFVGTPAVPVTISSGGVVSGTPDTAGDFDLEVQVIDQDSNIATKTVSFPVADGAGLGDDELLNGDPELFAFGVVGSSNPPSQSVRISTPATPVEFTVSPPAVGWLSLSPLNATTPATIQVAFDITGLAAGQYQATVGFTADHSAQTVTTVVNLEVVDTPASLAASPGIVRFDVGTSAPSSISRVLELENTGSGILPFDLDVVAGGAWLSVSPGSGSAAPNSPALVDVIANLAGLTAGYRTGELEATWEGGSLRIPVILDWATQPTLTMQPQGFFYEVVEGNGILGAPPVYSVVADLDAPAPWTAQRFGGDGWLALGSTSGQTSAGSPGSVPLTLTPQSLTPGEYYASVRVGVAGVANSPQEVIIVLKVVPSNAPTLILPDPAGLVFVSTPDQPVPNPQNVALLTGTATPTPFNAAAQYVDGAGWLVLGETSGMTSQTDPFQLAVAAVPGDLAPGVYRARVDLSSSNALVRSVNITLLVQAPSVAEETSIGGRNAAESGCVATRLIPTDVGLPFSFSSPASWPVPLRLLLADGCGNAISTGQVTATFSNGDPAVAMKLLDPSQGVYAATWVPVGALQKVTVSYDASASGFEPGSVKTIGAVTANAVPTLARDGIIHNLNPRIGGALAPGNIVQIFGANMSGGQEIPAELPLPAEVRGTSVLIGGFEAPLYFVSPGQINAQIPYELDSGRKYQVIVVANGALTIPESIQLEAVQPGIAAFPDGLVIAQHADLSLVSADNPAQPGEFLVIYLAGLGKTDNPVVSGEASPANPLARPLDTPVLRIGGQQADIFFAGLTPGLVGLYQINFQVPESASSGTQELVVEQSGVLSNLTTITIK